MEVAQNTNKAVIYWLFTGCALIFFMVIIGGITRLTQSGLSIVEWDLLMGSIPPLSETAWQELFIKYQQSPQYQLVNYHFSLEEFKSIFWWEYIHRLLGRLIGMAFIIPFIYFLIKKMISPMLLKKLLIIFFLGGFQGFLGWYMVKSGLVKDPAVSHYRLAAHLITAFLAFAYTFWVGLELFNNKEEKSNSAAVLKPSVFGLLAVVVFQIIYGAFVAGLKAGSIYTTFPKMGDEWIAESIPFAFRKYGFISFMENPASVQFIHRCLAFLILAFVIFIWRKSLIENTELRTKKAVNLLIIITGIQFLLGMFTLLFSVPVTLGVLHQAGAFVLFAVCIYLLYLSSAPELKFSPKAAFN